MEARNAFIGKAGMPSDAEVKCVLGASAPLWDELIEEVNADLGPLTPEWKGVYAHKYGWSMRLKQKSRNILYLSPCRGSFCVSFVLGDRAVSEAKSAHLPHKVSEALATAPHYPEGTGLRLEVKKEADLPAIRRLAQIKQAN